MNMDQLDFSNELFPNGEPRHLSYEQRKTELVNAFYNGERAEELMRMVEELCLTN